MIVLVALLACTGGKSTDTTTADSGTSAGTSSGPPVVEMVTSMGTIDIQLDEVAAPKTTANFLVYVDEGFYDGADGKGATIFHRVLTGFVDQGGGFTSAMSQKSTHDAIKLESDNGLSNLRGSIAMARTDQPNSATSQFFFNVVDNGFLDYSNASNPGYAVFGQITTGLDVIDAMAAVPVDGNGVPATAITITSCTRK